MKITYKSDYLSITQFNTVELPDFIVLTGINGSGKTHLLEAIQKGHVSIEGQEEKSIIYFDYRNFYLENEAEFNAYQLISERESAWNYFNQHLKNTINSHKNNFGPEYDLIKTFCTDKDISLMDLNNKDFGDHQDIIGACWQKYSSYKKEIKNLFEKHQNFKDNQQAKAIYVLLKKLTYSIDDISQEEFFKEYRPYTFKNDFLPLQLGKIIWDYYIKLDDNEYRTLRNIHKGKNYKVLSDKEFVSAYGEKPWEIMNKILSTFGSLKYEISNPETLELGREAKYKLHLIDKENGKIIDFSGLSSGEKILMALVASIYKSSSDKHFPEVLLLDEIDASLHPSMIQNLLDVINDIFVKNGTKVILVTHSPTTIALTPEKSVFIMQNQGENRIIKKNKNEALSLLTEGFATLEEGIKLIDQVAKKDFAIITEGNNVSYIQKALTFNKIKNIEIITGAENKTGKNQLASIFDFFAAVNHEKKVLFVLDCDVSINKNDRNNTYFFKFPQNKNNTIAKKGIENLFSEELFTKDFVIKVSKSDSEDTFFDENKKKYFEEMVMKRNNADDFIKFDSLIQKIIELKK